MLDYIQFISGLNLTQGSHNWEVLALFCFFQDS